jgi:predicted DNA binding CopG/RHH family protein
MRFAFEMKAAWINMRLQKSLLAAVKEKFSRLSARTPDAQPRRKR